MTKRKPSLTPDKDIKMPKGESFLESLKQVVKPKRMDQLTIHQRAEITRHHLLDRNVAIRWNGSLSGLYVLSRFVEHIAQDRDRARVIGPVEALLRVLYPLREETRLETGKVLVIVNIDLQSNEPPTISFEATDGFSEDLIARMREGFDAAA